MFILENNPNTETQTKKVVGLYLSHEQQIEIFSLRDIMEQLRPLGYKQEFQNNQFPSGSYWSQFGGIWWDLWLQNIETKVTLEWWL